MTSRIRNRICNQSTVTFTLKCRETIIFIFLFVLRCISAMYIERLKMGVWLRRIWGEYEVEKFVHIGRNTLTEHPIYSVILLWERIREIAKALQATWKIVWPSFFHTYSHDINLKAFVITDSLLWTQRLNTATRILYHQPIPSSWRVSLY